MSGIRNLEDLMQRCFVREETGCWEWRGSFTNGVPRIWLGDLQKVFTGPSAVRQLLGKPIGPGQRAWRTCMRSCCVAPDHVKAGTHAQWGAWKAKTGEWKWQPRRIAANRKPRKGSKLTPDLVQDILASAESCVAVGKRLGLSFQLVSKVRRGLAGKLAPMPSASVFNWRPA